MTVFEAKKIALQEYKKTVTEDIVNGNSKYIVVDDDSKEALIVPDEITARNCGCPWIFKGYVLNGETVINLIES